MGKKRLIAAGLLVALVIVAVLLLRSGVKDSPKISVYSSPPVASNITYPDRVNEGKVRFFTGSAVAEINLVNFTTKSITKEFSLPEASKFYWQGNKALVEFGRLEEFHDLYDLADNAGQASSWWLFDISRQTFKPLLADNGRVVDAVWRDSQNYYALTEQNSPASQDIGIYSADGGNLVEAYPGNRNLSLVGNSSKGLIAQRFNKILIIKEGGEEELPLSTGRAPHITNSGKSLVYEPLVDDKDSFGGSLETTRGSLFRYDLESLRTQKLYSDNSGNYASGAAEIVMFPASPSVGSNSGKAGDEGLIIDVLTGKTSFRLGVNEDSSRRIGALKKVVSLRQTENGIDMVIVNHADKLFAMSSDKSIENRKGASPLIPFLKEQISLSNGSMEYKAAYNTLIISTRSNSVATRNSVLSQIRKMGADPNQVAKVWSTPQETAL